MMSSAAFGEKIAPTCLRLPRLIQFNYCPFYGNRGIHCINDNLPIATPVKQIFTGKRRNNGS